MSTRRKITFGILGVYVFGLIAIVAIFGAARKDNPHNFEPAERVQARPLARLPGPFDLNKGVLYLFIATFLTLGIMLYISKRMQGRPNRVQTAVEWAYTGMRDKVVRDNMDEAMAKKWFPLVFTLFVFIWISNLIGYLPLPVNTEHKFDVFGIAVPLVPDLRRDGQRLDPARPGAHRVLRLQHRGRPGQGLLAATPRA